MNRSRRTDGQPARTGLHRNTSDAVVAFFAKAPIPGAVKTRLTPPLTPDEAATLHGSFVLDALERSATAASHGLPKQAPPRFDRVLACAPSSEHVFFKIMEERHRVTLLDQVGDDLGARMTHALTVLCARGYRKILLVGTDLPTLPTSIYASAFDMLLSHDVVLGPSLDGGYYLIGLTHAIPALFQNIPWSTNQVLAATVARAQADGLATAQLPAQRDIDTIDDVLAILEATGMGGTGAAAGKPGASALSKRTAGALRLVAERLKTRGLKP